MTIAPDLSPAAVIRTDCRASSSKPSATSAPPSPHHWW